MIECSCLLLRFCLFVELGAFLLLFFSLLLLFCVFVCCCYLWKGLSLYNLKEKAGKASSQTSCESNVSTIARCSLANDSARVPFVNSFLKLMPNVLRSCTVVNNMEKINKCEGLTLAPVISCEVSCRCSRDCLSFLLWSLCHCCDCGGGDGKNGWWGGLMLLCIF